MLSKYQEKIKKRYEKTESGKIAYAIFEKRKEIEALRKDSEEITLFDDINIGRDGYLSYCISKPVPYKGNRFWFKILPTFEEDIDKCADILDAQPWYYL